jgi:hypothetical protein
LTWFQNAGQALRGEIDRYSTYLVSQALSKRAPTERRALFRCLSLYVKALNQGNEANR